MHDRFPPDIDDFVQAQLAKGNCRSEQELMVDALRTFRELKRRYQDLFDELHTAIAQADERRLHPLDTEATKAEARRRLAVLGSSG